MRLGPLCLFGGEERAARFTRDGVSGVSHQSGFAGSRVSLGLDRLGNRLSPK